MMRKLRVCNSPIHGKGVFAAADFEAGEVVARYHGELKTREQLKADDAHGVESGHTFLFSLNDELVIDASCSRGAAKWCVSHGEYRFIASTRTSVCLCLRL